MSIAASIRAAGQRAVGGHAGRARDYATGRFAAADQQMGQGETEGEIRQTGDVIERVYASHAEAVTFALETLRELSPVRSGAYRESHVVLVNGAAASWPVALKPADVVVLTNTQPYARLIEGPHGASGLSDQAPNGVYEAAQAIVQARTTADVEFNYQGVVDGAAAPGHLATQSDYRYPALIIRRRQKR
ncbi:hypothetical protein [Roseospira visakhapatnamensis]|uniref:Uncharacterized protein n=1 Tax=Roseospira visakhapatnamensis TaxID=390880 RepID=A0A7W6RFQ4_9PROT|nr:hypothetical protein [Roseospira visakhapatnamensis]MBB4267729.1 hypothetical protein [Roseospira visakhapatnamensis]